MAKKDKEKDPLKKKIKPLPRRTAPLKRVLIRPDKSVSGEEEILDIIFSSGSRGISIKSMEKKTDFSFKKIYNIIYRLKKKGQIENVGWGLYRKK